LYCCREQLAPVAWPGRSSYRWSAHCTLNIMPVGHSPFQHLDVICLFQTLLSLCSIAFLQAGGKRESWGLTLLFFGRSSNDSWSRWRRSRGSWRRGGLQWRRHSEAKQVLSGFLCKEACSGESTLLTGQGHFCISSSGIALLFQQNYLGPCITDS
jgi:hypothetical protein